jgi:hypothetical protein
MSVFTFPLMSLNKFALNVKSIGPGEITGIGVTAMSMNLTCGDPQSDHCSFVNCAFDKEANKQRTNK